MNRRISYLVIAVAALFMMAGPMAFARKGKPGNELRLVSIDVTNSKITVSDPSGKDINTLTVMHVTKITVDGQPGKLADLHKGMHVVLAVSQGGKVADKIDATTPSPPQQ